MAPKDTPSLRRNGRVPSCEPCRKSKLACDHGRPVCRRCQARGKTRLCSYHPAPMTGMGKKARLARESDAAALLINGPDHITSPTISVAAHAEASVSPSLGNAKTPFARTVSGYLGTVSYLGPLYESERGLAEADVDSDEAADGMPAVTHDAAQIDDGVRVLRALWPLSQLDSAAIRDRNSSICSISPPAVIAAICESIERMFACSPEKVPDERKLRSLAATISGNTAKRLKPPGRASMTEWTSSFTGPHLRWEAVGLVFSRLSLLASPLGTSGIWTADVKFHAYWKRLIDSTNLCLSLCDQLTGPSDLSFWCMSENLTVLTLFHGDAGYVPWKRLGDLSSALFALGFHLEINVTVDVPRWLVEYRRLGVINAFTSDKTICGFVGRPPRIHARSCMLQAPSALSRSQLCLSVEELDAEIARMGEDLFHFKKITDFGASASHLLPLMDHREKILELFLCHRVSQTEAAAEIEEIMSKSAQQWALQPPGFTYSPEIWDSGRTAHECYAILMIYLDHMYNDFLVQRYRVQRLHSDPDDLLALSSRLLADGLIVVQMRGKIGGGNCDVPWMIAYFCLPAAGVLALALLRAAQNRTPPTRAFSKSQVIQNLSVLAGALDWVATPGVGNFTLCQQARTMLRRIIDRILDPAADDADAVAYSAAAGGAGGGGGSGGNGFMPSSVPMLGTGESSWLGATNPADELWDNLEEHSLLMLNSANTYWH